jgi:hypothetical protein
MQGMVKVLALRARAELELNRTDDALADLQTGFRLLGATWDEKLLISGLVRITWVSIMMQPIWEGIASHRWTDAQLGQIEGELRRLDFLADYEGVIRGERAASNYNYDRVRANPALGIAQTAYMGDKYEKALMSCARYFPGLLYQNQISTNQLVQAKILPLVDVGTRRFNVREEARSREYFESSRNFGPYNYLSKSTLRNYMIIDEKYAFTQVSVDEALIACEIERYRIAHGSLPATLEELHMADLPRDIINGGPLHYRVKGEDYILYSVGWNETDDGGKIMFESDSKTRVDQKQGDWVWSLKPL